MPRELGWGDLDTRIRERKDGFQLCMDGLDVL